jgi:hypothetical protein
VGGDGRSSRGIKVGRIGIEEVEMEVACREDVHEEGSAGFG